MSYYGPGGPDHSYEDNRKFRRDGRSEADRERRVKIRWEMRGRVNVWDRSPSPPQRKENKVDSKATKIETIKVGKTSSKNKAEERSSKKSKSTRKRSYSTTSSSSSSSSSSSTSSSSSSSSSLSDRKKSRKKRSKKSVSSDSERRGKQDASKTDRKNAYVVNMETALSGAAMIASAAPVPNEYELEEARRFQADVQGSRKAFEQYAGAESSDDDFGPKPMDAKLDLDKKVSYGGSLLPGEGAAIAQYVQQNVRIPRRGEIGWKADEIEGLETQGYVMSGSRHKRMNAIRLRKENQVYSAEEKRALALITMEEKQQKESQVIGEFRQMLTKKLKESGHDASDGGHSDSGHAST
ncbi:hypothetical protein EON65_16660 [archaeon]|nr:MAG: hypothetical protein EON65_16660 [archaeon]